MPRRCALLLAPATASAASRSHRLPRPHHPAPPARAAAPGRSATAPCWRALTGIDVVNDFRSADVAAGGEGAPLVPLLSPRAGRRRSQRPLAVLNIGGVANVTWIGAARTSILAFDTGPGNALIDDWVLRHTGRAVDADGALAARGPGRCAARGRASCADPYFAPRPAQIARPRRLRAPRARRNCRPADGAATLDRLHRGARWRRRRGISRAPPRAGWSPAAAGTTRPSWRRWRARLGVPVEPVEAVGWDGDALEAQAFAYLAVRSLAACRSACRPTTGARHPDARRPAAPGPLTFLTPRGVGFAGGLRESPIWRSSKPNPGETGASVRLGDRYDILPGSPAEGFRSPAAEAYRVIDRDRPSDRSSRSSASRACRRGRPLIDSLVGAARRDADEAARWGVVDWPLRGRRCFALIFEEPVTRLAATLDDPFRR